MKKYIIISAVVLTLLIPVASVHATSACYYFDKCLTGGLTDEEFEAYHAFMLNGKPINYADVAQKTQLRQTKEKLIQVWVEKMSKDFGIGKDMLLGVIGK